MWRVHYAERVREGELQTLKTGYIIWFGHLGIKDIYIR